MVLSLVRLVFRDNANLQLFPVNLSDRFHLSNDVAEEPLSLCDVVQVESFGCFVGREECRRTHVGVAESQVLVEVHESVQEISEVATQHAEETGVTVATDVLGKVLAEHHHDVVFLFAEFFSGGIDEGWNDTLLVDLYP